LFVQSEHQCLLMGTTTICAKRGSPLVTRDESQPVDGDHRFFCGDQGNGLPRQSVTATSRSASLSASLLPRSASPSAQGMHHCLHLDRVRMKRPTTSLFLCGERCYNTCVREWILYDSLNPFPFAGYSPVSPVMMSPPFSPVLTPSLVFTAYVLES
jgi:hypothetical protein